MLVPTPCALSHRRQELEDLKGIALGCLGVQLLSFYFHPAWWNLHTLPFLPPQAFPLPIHLCLHIPILKALLLFSLKCPCSSTANSTFERFQTKYDSEHSVGKPVPVFVKPVLSLSPAPWNLFQRLLKSCAQGLSVLCVYRMLGKWIPELQFLIHKGKAAEH